MASRASSKLTSTIPGRVVLAVRVWGILVACKAAGRALAAFGPQEIHPEDQTKSGSPICRRKHVVLLPIFVAAAVVALTGDRIGCICGDYAVFHSR
jgi:hypothetical protein